jgi:hypothetical protein
MDGTATLTSEKLLRPQGVSESQGATTKLKFQSFTLHLEYRDPFMPDRTGQGRGNSGVYLQGRHELQILDSFGLTLMHGADTMAAKRECGAFFEQTPPALNMSFPPLSWQTYDVIFTAARYDGQTRLEPAHCTVRHNGVTIHDDLPMAWPTLLGDPVGPGPGPLRFQSHGDPVDYRNVWLVENTGSAVKPAPRRRASLSSPSARAGVDGRVISPGHAARGYHIGYPTR